MNSYRACLPETSTEAGMAITSLLGHRQERLASVAWEMEEGFTEGGTSDLGLKDGKHYDK